MRKNIKYIFCEGQRTGPPYFEGFERLIEDNPIYWHMVLIEIEPCATETMRVICMADNFIPTKNGSHTVYKSYENTIAIDINV